tara:strand:+ start:209 stop:1246 length:1038 start_codon:yes stop_codon:yes gene_type:complete
MATSEFYKSTLLLAKTTTVDYMEAVIYPHKINLIKEQDRLAVDANSEFSVSQLLSTARIFKSLVTFEWVQSVAMKVTGRIPNTTGWPYLADQPSTWTSHYHHRQSLQLFIQLFTYVKIDIDNGVLFSPSEHYTFTFNQQKGITGKSVIHINNFKIALYNFLMRKTTKERAKKLEAITKKQEALLLLIIACSIGLPTRNFTKAYDFFVIYYKNYTLVNDDNIIRTLLNSNGFFVDEIKEYGNRTLELWEMYKKQFPHFKPTVSMDASITETLYSYPTPVELRHIVPRAMSIMQLLTNNTETGGLGAETGGLGDETGGQRAETGGDGEPETKTSSLHHKPLNILMSI